MQISAKLLIQTMMMVLSLTSYLTKHQIKHLRFGLELIAALHYSLHRLQLKLTEIFKCPNFPQLFLISQFVLVFTLFFFFNFSHYIMVELKLQNFNT